MAFWGVEVKPGKPFRQIPSAGVGSQLHLSQATLGTDPKKGERSLVKVKVGEGPEIHICSLTGGAVESCPLDLIFAEDATFSVTGTTSVHLTGYYMPTEMEEDDEDEFGEDIEGAEFDMDDDEDDEFDEDEEDEDDESDEDGIFGRRPVLASERGVIIEDLIDADEKAAAKPEEKGSKDEDEEDEDGFVTKPAKKKQAVQGKDSEKPVAVANGKKAKPEKAEKKADKAEKQAEKAKVQAKSETLVAKQDPKGKDTAKKPVEAVKKEEDKKEIKAGKGGKGTKRVFPNGLELEELAMGKPDGKKAAPGKKVFVKYVGRLKSNNKVFDASKKPFAFHLGVGEVIKGWDVGVVGMRVGDKRRLTIPPQMGYGARGAPPDIPGNATLVFDVELCDVKG